MVNKFEPRCQELFGKKLGMGRRWKTAAAQALGISRATLYRYFEDDGASFNQRRSRHLQARRHPLVWFHEQSVFTKLFTLSVISMITIVISLGGAFVLFVSWWVLVN